MKSGRPSSDAGQAFPIYITVIGGLLLMALVYLAVGQAAANRSGAQTAADAAALAAAQDRRDQLVEVWGRNILDPATWGEVFAGDVASSPTSCARAEELATRNDAEVLSCLDEGLLAFTVEVESTETVGESVVPGTEELSSNAQAMAVIESRCTFDLPPGGFEEGELPRLFCGDDEWDLGEDGSAGRPEARDLFRVHLADR
ncbi:pilus assembly protein TadG-related protein [Streptomyces sp. WMMC905]|uniref:pilus assembly protein TadG-related protein n=1 Tax=Streptomyces sp. WMMC905 TaxID=3404123 RepID=UPI003B94A308